MTTLGPGTVLGDTWEIEKLIGRGGMGEVWQARHTRVPGKLAAVKTLHSFDAQRDELLTRFRREAEIAARLEHPNIVQLFDYAVLPSGAPYLVMELLKGESLRSRLTHGPMSLEELQPLVLQLGSALSVAHEHGVVHRDLKPDNIFIITTPTGPLAKVLDFGISKLLDSKSVQTGNSVLLGTPLYMSPEQAAGENDRLSAKSDVFSLASVCHQALLGEPPFVQQGLIRVVHSIMYDEPRPIAGLPRAVAEALEAAFRKDPDRRSSIHAFVEGFCGVKLNAPPVAVPPKVAQAMPPDVTRVSRPSRAPPSSRASRRRPALVLLGLATGLAAVVAATTSGSWKSPRPLERDAGVVLVLRPELPALLPPLADAGGTPPGPATPGRTAPLSSAQAEAVAQLEADLKEGNYVQVIEGSLRPLVATVGRSVELRVMAYCAVGNLGLAVATAQQVESRAVRKFCQEHGIEVR